MPKSGIYTSQCFWTHPWCNLTVKAIANVQYDSFSGCYMRNGRYIRVPPIMAEDGLLSQRNTIVKTKFTHLCLLFHRAGS